MGTVYQQNPSEMQRHESMGLMRVAPVAMMSQQHQPPPPVRPKLSDLKGICRNLFDDSPQVGEISQILAAKQRKKIDYVNNLYKIDLGQDCNQKISALNKCESDSGDALPNTRPQGLKRTFRVCKATTPISNVPKRIRDNLSSEMGTNGQKETEEEKVETKKKVKIVDAKKETEVETKKTEGETKKPDGETKKPEGETKKETKQL